MSNVATRVKPPVAYYPDFLNPDEAARLFGASAGLTWTRAEIVMYGKTIPVPHDETLFGDPGLTYAYRGTTEAEPWPDFLADVRDRIAALSGFRFNFVVGNRYRDGKDSIGWHSDELPTIGERPAIGSLSLGGTRKFKLRNKQTGDTFDYELTSGALLVMLPGCQEEWVHAVPKTARAVAERINWTFRPHVDAK